MTDSDSSSPPEPPNKAPAAPRRIVRSESDHPSNAQPEGRDRPRVDQRVFDQRPSQRAPADSPPGRRAKPDLRDLPPPSKDGLPNVWRADPPRARQEPRGHDERDRREGPRRAYGDAPRPDRPGERRTYGPAGRGDGPAQGRGDGPGQGRGDGPRNAFQGERRPPTRHEFDPRNAPRQEGPRGQDNPNNGSDRRPDDRDAPRPAFRKDDRRATGFAPGPPRDRPANDRPRYNGPRDDNRGAQADQRDAPRYQGPRDDMRGHGTERPREEQHLPPAARPAPHVADPTQPRREDQRLSKVLAERGVASRREADDWIDAGWVKVDGQMAVLGARVFPHQNIEIDPRARTQQARRVTILVHKPIGYVSGQAEDGYEPAIVLVTPENHWEEDPSREQWHPGHARGIAPAGRLDIDSTGMLVLTQDGRIARHLIGEDSDVEKEYLVRVEYPSGGPFPENDMERLRHGLWLDGRELRPAKVSWANEDQLRFVLREGRKRQIRRMCEAVGLVVTGLKRVRIGSVVLGKLPMGQWRYLREDERF